MNTYLFASVENVWLLAGWTMIHFLWLGTLVALAALPIRWILRRASPNVRYVTALACLSTLASLPVAIALWLSQNPTSLQFEDSQWRATASESLVAIAAPAAETKLMENAPIELAPRNSSVPPLERNSALVTPESHRAPSPQPPVPSPSSLAVFAINTSVHYLPWLWLIGTPITFALTATGLIGTRRLRLSSRPITDGPIAETLAKLAASLRLTRRVAVAVCDRIAAPVLIGILRPIILLPPAALTGYSPDEIEMVLLHELAHVRRWDNLVNLLQRVVESLLFFHPAVWLISSWVRRERESCCDALVVTRTDRPHAYAELLVALAAQMPRSVLFHPAASSAMAAGPLRSRIRRILKLDDDPMLVSGKSFALVLGGLLLSATLAVLYVPSIGQAEQSATEATANAEKNDSIPEPVLIPFKFVLKQRDSGKPRLYMNDQPVGEDVVRDVISRQGKYVNKLYVSLSAEKGINYADVMKVVDLLESLGVKNLALDNRDEMLASKDRAKAADDWPAGVTFPSPKEGEISSRAWRELHLKVIPAIKTEQAAKNASAIKIVGGAGLPPGVDAPVFLLSLNDIDAKDFDQLDAALKTVHGQKLVVAKCVTNTPQGPNWIKIALDDSDKPTHTISRPPTFPPTPVNPAKPFAKFPSLEDQKLADLAYRRLELELEPINAGELQRVKAFGYDGGVRVAKPAGHAEGLFQPGDILVGLHVWPTRTLKDVADVLNRDDLQELNPLKFYVVRPGRPQNGFGSGPEEDAVITGRISPNESRPSARTINPPSPPTPTTWNNAPAASPDSHYHVAPRADDSWHEATSTRSSREPTPAPVPYIPRVTLDTQADRWADPQPTSPSAPQVNTVPAAPSPPTSSRPFVDPQPNGPFPQQPSMPISVDRAETILNDAAKKLDAALKVKQEALAKRQQAKGHDDVEAAKHELETADRQLEDAKRQLEKAQRAIEENAQIASKKIEAAMKAKQDALVKRQQAKGEEAVEAAKRELEKANRQLEDAKRSLEKEIHSAETGNSNAQPTLDINPRPPVAVESSSGSASASASPEELEIFRDQVKTLEDQLKFTNERLKSGKGATELDCLRVGCELALAQSDLALAEGKFDLAVSKLGEARKSAENALKLSTTSFQAGTGTDYTAVIEAKRKLGDIKLKLIRLQRPPYVAPLAPPGNPSGSTLPSPPRVSTAPPATGDAPAAPNGYAVVIEKRIAPDGRPVYESRTVPKASALDDSWTPVTKRSAALAPVPSTPYSSAPTPASPDTRVPVLPSTPAVPGTQYPEYPVNAPYSPPKSSTNPTTPPADAKPALRYDGKTFGQWQNAWRTELSTEKRIEAVKALATFGANGYGKEAAEVIIEVAGQYDWTSTTPNTVLDPLRAACVEAFGGEGAKSAIAQSIPANDALPALAAAAKSGSRQQKLFLLRVLPGLSNPESVAARLTLSNEPDALIRKKALQVLPQLMSNAHDDKVAARVREALGSNDPDDVVAAMFVIVPYPNTPAAKSPYPYLPDLMKLLYSPHESVRKHARELLKLIKGDDATHVAEAALAVLKDNAQKQQHLEAIRALAALGPSAKPAVDTLRPLLKSDDQTVAIAAANALRRNLNPPEYGKLLVEQLGDRFNLQMQGNTIQLPGGPKQVEFNAFERAVQDEERQLFP
jgi:beta-lactamase regulating signal transducer with metallopeptidase domain